jgi:hypothetical protein
VSLVCYAYRSATAAAMSSLLSAICRNDVVKTDRAIVDIAVTVNSPSVRPTASAFATLERRATPGMGLVRALRSYQIVPFHFRYYDDNVPTLQVT